MYSIWEREGIETWVLSVIKTDDHWFRQILQFNQWVAYSAITRNERYLNLDFPNHSIVLFNQIIREFESSIDRIDMFWVNWIGKKLIELNL